MNSTNQTNRTNRTSMRIKIVLLSAILIFVGFNYTVYTKEHLRKSDETILLELMPVDPRSLMQGDYMALSYDIERHATQALGDVSDTAEYIVIGLDPQNVGEFKRFYDGENLDKDERLFSITISANGLRVIPNAFFFQEGHAKYYENAQYGVFKCDAKGNHLLIGLADTEQKLIDPPRKNIFH